MPSLMTDDAPREYRLFTQDDGGPGEFRPQVFESLDEAEKIGRGLRAQGLNVTVEVRCAGRMLYSLQL